MALDPSILLSSGRGVTPLNIPTAEELMRQQQMRQQMADQQAQRQAFSNAFNTTPTVYDSPGGLDNLANAGMGMPSFQSPRAVVAPGSGQHVFDQDAYLQGMQKASPEAYFAAQKQRQDAALSQIEQHRKAAQQQHDEAQQVFDLASTAKDQASYDWALSEAERQGHDISFMPKVYDPLRVQQMADASVSMKDRALAAIRNLDAQSKGLQAQTNAAEAERRASMPVPAPKAARGSTAPPASAVGIDMAAPLKDPGEEALAQAIARKEQSPIVPSTRNPRANVINGRAAAINGGVLPGSATVHEQQAGMMAFGPKGQQGQTIQSIDTAAGHITRGEELIRGLANGDMQSVNAASNWFKTHIQGSPNVTNFEGVRSFVIPEVLKVAKGSGVITESEEKNLRAIASSASSPAQLQGFYTELKHIMASRAQALQPTFERYFPGQSIADRLRPDTRAMFSKLGVSFAPSVPGSATPQAPPAGITVGMIPKKSDGTVLPDDVYKGFTVNGGKVVSVGGR